MTLFQLLDGSPVHYDHDDSKTIDKGTLNYDLQEHQTRSSSRVRSKRSLVSYASSFQLVFFFFPFFFLSSPPALVSNPPMSDYKADPE
jgi:hypothetical protein